MARVPITVMGYRCERCEHEWVPRDNDQEPRVCPKCKSPYWNKPRRGLPMSYEEFRGRTRGAIETAKRPMTWTEVRTTARLPQAFPNNGWVRRMEADPEMKLIRSKDSHGIILWSLPGIEGSVPSAIRGTSTANRTRRRSKEQQSLLE